MKVGKEEMVGLLAAVERYLKLDHAAREAYCEAKVRTGVSLSMAFPVCQAQRSFPNEAQQPLPRCHVTVEAELLGLNRDQVVARLAGGAPAVIVEPVGIHGIYLNPMTLEPGQEVIVLSRLLEIIAAQPKS